MKDEKLTNRHKQILRFVLFIKLFDLQYPTFYKEVAGKFKQRLNNFTAHLHQVRTIFENNANPEVAQYLDNVSAIAWEVFDELDKAEDKKMFLEVCKAYNAGGIVAKEDEDVAVNAPEFKTLLQAKSEAA